MIEFLRDNAGWLKDIFTILFAATGTVIAILTYRRARHGILQPIRNEVVKTQAQTLKELLKEFGPAFGLEDRLDYINVVSINVILQLRDLGFVFSGHDELIKKQQSFVGAIMPLPKSDVVEDVEVVQAFKSDKKGSDWKDRSKELYEKAKAGDLEIQNLYLTTRHAEYVNRLSQLAQDPFLPKAIQKVLNRVIEEKESNLRRALKDTIESFLNAFFAQSETGSYPQFDPVGVYNDFNHCRIHHKSSADELRSVTRRYLRIDEDWG
jgi:hypothetical protein